MAKRIFLNLPVTDLDRSVRFYEAIGCTRNDHFSNEKAAAMNWSDTIHFMLLTHAFYATFTPKQIIDAKNVSGALIALSLDSRADVDAISAAAVAGGGRELHGPEDEGFMYSRAFEDPDGHGFGPFWMDMDAALAAIADNTEAQPA